MKMQEAKKVVVGGSNFYIRPFSAFKAARISGDVLQVAVPIIGAMLPALNVADGKNILDSNVEEFLPHITKGFEGLSGEKLEALLRTLLVESGNIGVDFNGETVILTEEILDELFCLDVQYMYVLAFHAVITNYSGFFKKLGIQFGGVTERLKNLTAKFQNTEN